MNFAEVVDEEGASVLIPFHRVIRLVKAKSSLTEKDSVIFFLDSGMPVVVPVEPAGEAAWGAYRQWVSRRRC